MGELERPSLDEEESRARASAAEDVTGAVSRSIRRASRVGRTTAATRQTSFQQ
jgi:hypothetical protein